METGGLRYEHVIKLSYISNLKIFSKKFSVPGIRLNTIGKAKQTSVKGMLNEATKRPKTANDGVSISLILACLIVFLLRSGCTKCSREVT